MSSRSAGAVLVIDAVPVCVCKVSVVAFTGGLASVVVKVLGSQSSLEEMKSYISGAVQQSHY